MTSSMAFSLPSGEAAFGGESSEDSDGMTRSKRVRQLEDKRSASSKKMDACLWSTLDHNLVEKVVARLPFKSLFQASSLSKTWSLKLFSRSYQSEVLRSTSTWKSYFPLCVNFKQELVGFESDSQIWCRLPTHSYVPASDVQEWCLRAGCGALLCWTANVQCSSRSTYQVYVSNPLTKTWKRLPARRDMGYPEVVHVGCQGSKAYEVILILFGWPSIQVQIFDSTSSSWTLASYSSETGLDIDWSGSAYMNGMVYLAGVKPVLRCAYGVISFNVKEKIWKEIPLLYLATDEDFIPNEDEKRHQPLKFFKVQFFQVIVCGSDVMLVVMHRDEGSLMDADFDDDIVITFRLSVFRFDLECGLAFEVSRAPNEMVSAVDVCMAVGQGDCIYIGGYFPCYRSILYNVGTQEWHWVPPSSNNFLNTSWRWTSTIYEPGLNPFIEV